MKNEMKLSRHNGRSGKNEAYNAKHNDRRFDVRKANTLTQKRQNRINPDDLLKSP